MAAADGQGAARLGPAVSCSGREARAWCTPTTSTARSTCAASSTSARTRTTCSAGSARPTGATALHGARAALVEADGTVTGIVLVLRDVHRQTAVLRALATLSRVNEAMVRAEDEDGAAAVGVRRRGRDGLYPLVWFGRPQHDEAQSVVPGAVAGPAAPYLDQVAFSWGDGELGQGTDGARRAHRNDPGARRHRLRPRLRAVARDGGRRTASPARSRCRSGSTAPSRACSGCTPRSRGRSTTWRSRCSRTSPPTSASA